MEHSLATLPFNVVQFVTMQWRAAASNADARPAFYGREKIVIDPVFYQWMDERVDQMNRHGIVAAPKDNLYQTNVDFKSLLDKLKIPYAWEVVPKVAHCTKCLYDKVGLEGMRFMEANFDHE